MIHTTCLATEQATLDTQRVQAFYRENLGLIYRYVYSKMGNREEAEDLTSQDSFGVNSKPAERVQRILQALPQHYREVLNCRFLLSLSVRDTARRLGLTEGNVRILQSRALKRAADLEGVATVPSNKK